MADMTVTEGAKALDSEDLSHFMQMELDTVSTQLAHQCEFLNTLENADLGPVAEALAFAWLATIKEITAARDDLYKLTQRLSKRESSLEGA